MTLIRNRYRQVRQLAQTTYGGIYLCNDEFLRPRRVVLKSVSLVQAINMLDLRSPELQAPDDPRQEKTFALLQRSEAAPHPNIVQYLDDFIEDQPCFGRVGKAYYMAPEVVLSRDVYDSKAADVWSLGIILFILVTGSPLVPLAANEDAAFRAFRKVGLREVLEAWHMDELLARSAMELLDGMLQCDPTKRLTIEQVLNHEAFDRRAIAA
ncbi:hypothetical protein PC120_g3393 [Phytophthora cactorum]|nr:hypothetical protein PC120_g3393 [Phytophthora cactorum]